MLDDDDQHFQIHSKLYDRLGKMADSDDPEVRAEAVRLAKAIAEAGRREFDRA
ncbi:hypothetical protein O7626_40245 [Micromonospora sp. WMMD1102]|uniref:hypothetical protein n=1 Tax=Micromonospora sp. WMMD1102 TaxID=3016105 RepID=UPI0024153745|nr:hypothetical protein [Micromonospora sp. WMMD1102]MDG4792049.1 hypothetical protein [Micromonospora sp. WMMD1102]